jgi:hypothetical protein
MNTFWKGIVVSIAVHQFVLTYCILYLADYFMWSPFSSTTAKKFTASTYPPPSHRMGMRPSGRRAVRPSCEHPVEVESVCRRG